MSTKKFTKPVSEHENITTVPDSLYGEDRGHPFCCHQSFELYAIAQQSAVRDSKFAAFVRGSHL